MSIPLKLYVADQVRRNRERLSWPLRVASKFPEYTHRRTVARAVAPSGAWDVSPLEQLGYLSVATPPPLVGPLVEAARGRLPEAAAAGQSRNKPFFSQLLLDADRQLSSVFLRLALDDVILATVARYLGLSPFLESIELLYSRPLAGPPSLSQQWHRDRSARRIVKMFVYATDVREEHGPLTLLPREESNKVPERLFHYIPDAQISRYADLSKAVAFTGPAGTTTLLDSQACYHLGSRCREPRLAYVAYYTSGFGYRPRETTWRLPDAEVQTLRPLQRLALGLP